MGEGECVPIILVSRKLWLILGVVEGKKAIWFGAGASLRSVDLGNKGAQVSLLSGKMIMGFIQLSGG